MTQTGDGDQGQQPTQPFDWKAFSQQTWVVVAAGLFLPPIGIVLAWLKPDWTTKGKWIATGLMGLMLMSILSRNDDKNAKERPAPSSPSEEAPRKQPEAPPVAAEEKPKREKPKSDTMVIAADDLVGMNQVAVTKKMPRRFVVTGRVMEMKTSKGSWGKTRYTINISGDSTGYQRKNARGYVDRWVECEFSDDTGLENIKGGQFVYVEGQYEDNLTGSVVRMNKCRLSPEHHVLK